jgi:hypothetical protein
MTDRALTLDQVELAQPARVPVEKIPAVRHRLESGTVSRMTERATEGRVRLWVTHQAITHLRKRLPPGINHHGTVAGLALTAWRMAIGPQVSVAFPGRPEDWPQVAKFQVNGVRELGPARAGLRRSNGLTARGSAEYCPENHDREGNQPL